MGKKILKYDGFLEKKLELGDLKERPERGTALVKKLRDKEDVAMDSGAVVKIDKMKDPDIDGDWVDAAAGVDNITDDSGEFDIVKAASYFKNVKPKDQRTNKFRTNTYVPVFLGIDGKEYTLTDLKKDASFGSTGAGVKIREHESIQMIFLAKRLAQNFNFQQPKVQMSRGKKKYSYPDIASVLESLVGATKFEFGRTIAYPAPGFVLTEEMAAYYSADQSWLSTFCNVPNKLVNQHDSKGNKVLSNEISYNIYHVSSKDPKSVPNAIFAKFKQLSKMRANEDLEAEAPPAPQRYGKPFDRASGEEIEFSKYCPADIYVVHRDKVDSIIKGIDSCGDILELNTYMNECFSDRTMIPISLKRVGPSPRSATLIVNAEEGMEIPKFDVDRFQISASASQGIGSKIMTNSYWIHKRKPIERERNMTLDSPNTRKNGNIDAEIDGVWARHGKISLLWIKKFIESSDIYQSLQRSHDYRIMEWQELQKKNMDELKDMLGRIRMEIEKLVPEMKVKVAYSNAGKDIGDSEKKMISKIQSLQVIRALAAIDAIDKDLNGESDPAEEEKRESEVDRIVSNMLLYALSIKNPGFSSPKYVRVI